MFQYEYEKRPSSANSFDSRATMSTNCSRSYPAARTGPTVICPSVERARRPLPPRPIVCDRMPTKTSVPLKVWIIASASCFAVCAALVLATVVITKWGTSDFTQHQHFVEAPEPIYKPSTQTKVKTTTPETKETTTEEINDIQMPIIERLFYKNIFSNRDKKQKEINLASKHQFHPIHDDIHHLERKIEKKDQAKYTDMNVDENNIPEFKPTLPDVVLTEVEIPEFVNDIRKHDDYYEEYYNDENFYNDYIQGNSMTSYLIEKVQELHDWITSDTDFDDPRVSVDKKANNQFGQVLKALNESLIEGNVTIIMNKLKDIYFGDNYTNGNHSRQVVMGNSTDLLSFGILTLDVILLHNIQLMAWENQEATRTKMLKDPDVFAFNALFLDPTKLDAKKNEVYHEHDNYIPYSRRQNLRQDSWDDFDFGKNLLENILEIGMSTARAAIHLGRAYKNTKMVLNNLSNKEALNNNIQSQISRNIDGNTHALNHLQTSFNSDSSSVANATTVYTELECVWLLYCRNLMATSKMNPPYGTMARINGMALRLLTGDLSADRALDTMLYEALTGWTDLKCADMFPRCSKVNAASVVLDSILQPLKKTPNKTR